MATIAVTYDDAAEAAIGQQCADRFGADVLDALVTNWLQGHAENFKREQVATILKAAATDPAVQTQLDAVTTAATASLAAASAVAVPGQADGITS